MNHEQNLDSPLSPLQWLTLVLKVWFDPLWYWRHVRTRLTDRRQAWSLFLQGLLGAELGLLLAAALLWLVFLALGERADFVLAAGAATRGLLLAAITALIITMVSAATERQHAWTWATGFGVLAAVFLGLAFAVLALLNDPSDTALLVFAAVFGLIAGYGISISAGLVGGVTLHWVIIVILAAAGLIAGNWGGMDWFQTLFILTGVVGIVLGKLRIERQEPDEARRRRMARPE